MLKRTTSKHKTFSISQYTHIHVSLPLNYEKMNKNVKININKNKKNNNNPLRRCFRASSLKRKVGFELQ